MVSTLERPERLLLFHGDSLHTSVLFEQIQAAGVNPLLLLRKKLRQCLPRHWRAERQRRIEVLEDWYTIETVFGYQEAQPPDEEVLRLFPCLAEEVSLWP